MPVVFHHAVRLDAETGLSFGLFLEVCPNVHPASVEPAKERLAVFFGFLNEVYRAREELLVDSLHALLGERTSILNFLSAVGVRKGMNHTPGTELLPERGVLRIVHVLRLLLCVQVVEVAEELVEAVVRGQVLIQVAEMVLAELAGGIAKRLQ